MIPDCDQFTPEGRRLLDSLGLIDHTVTLTAEDVPDDWRSAANVFRNVK